MSRRGRRCALVLLALLCALPAAAQIHLQTDAPWAAVADTAGRGGADFVWDRGLGGEPRWRTDRLELTIRFPVGARAVAYLRGSYVRLDTGDAPALSRWPGILSEEPTIDVGTWPGESLLEDFGQPELGLLVPSRLPWLGDGDAALQVTAPFGKDETYPLSCRALVMRLEWRRRELALGPVSISGRVGWEIAMDASGDAFGSEAFPDGLRFGVTAGTALAAPRGWTVGWAARELSGGHHSRRAEASAWTSTATGHRARLFVIRELGARSHRITDWRLGLAFELRRPPAEDED